TLAGYLVTALPLSVLFTWRLRGVGRWVSLAVAMLSVAAIALTLTRGAWIALASLAIGSAIMAALTGHRRVVGIAFSTSVAVFAGIWLIAGPAFRHGMVERLAHFTEGAGRVHLWRSGLAMAEAYPITGVGLDTFPLAFGRFRPPEYWL